ncbi:hypothetical protein AB8Q00_23975 [Bacillus cereus]|uniref:hypothetical protein n=1 Tax=Bacillus cereus TaxID=1396 RepID=UPI00350E54A5
MENKNKLDLIDESKDIIETAGNLLGKGHEIVDTLSEYSPYVRLANNLMNKRREQKCENFLKGLAMKVFSREDLTADDLRELNRLIEKNVNMTLILDILEEATKTVSNTSSKLLGVIAGQVMKGQQTFTYNEWILTNALKNMNDWDIDNFKKVYSYFEEHPEDRKVSTTCLIQNISMEEYVQMRNNSLETKDHSIQENIMNNEEFKMLKSSLMRMSNFQILSVGPVAFALDSVTFEGNQVGDELYKLIQVIERYI